MLNMINILKFSFSLLFLWIAFRVVNFHTVVPIIMHADRAFIIFAFILQLGSTMLAAYRWSLIMSALHFHQNFVFYLGSYFKGAFFNQALPGSIGGDAVRGLELGSLGYSKKEAFAGIFIDRIVGLVGLLILNFGANLLSNDLLPIWLFHLVNMICIGGMLGFSALIVLHKIRWLHTYKATRVFANLSHRFRQVYATKEAIVVQVGLSVIIHFLSVLAFYEIARSVGIPLPLSLFLVVVPPVFLLTIIPISLAGWGVRESAMVGIFILVGGSKEAILSVSLLYGIMLIVASLPGLFIWLKGKKLV
ncbi:MAG: lysylphosphatidylglycerol synthase transmembrane domain-containing protein [Sulfuricurvum sp.]|nr:lysylphosphatidylglycerol synthase transmembrane domain-containing protein [Sulfuricurvum sp.]